jgi:hypothetical protein
MACDRPTQQSQLVQATGAYLNQDTVTRKIEEPH